MISEKHNKLVTAYFKHNFNKSKALKEVGYRSNYNEVWNHPDVKNEIKRRQGMVNTKEQTRVERIVEFWLKIMEDTAKPINSRIRASENIAKYEGMFTEKIEVTQNVDLKQRIIDARKRIYNPDETGQE